MNALLVVLIRTVPAVLAKLLVALAGPTIRGLKLRGDELDVLLGYVAMLTLGTVPTYAPLNAYSSSDVQDIAESLHDLVVLVLSQYEISLSGQDIATMAEALGARLLSKYPAPVPPS